MKNWIWTINKDYDSYGSLKVKEYNSYGDVRIKYGDEYISFLQFINDNENIEETKMSFSQNSKTKNHLNHIKVRNN